MGERFGEQHGVAQQVVQELLLALFAGVQVTEHFAARVGNQAQRFVAAVAAGRQVDALAQADEVALLQIEQRPFIDQCMQQAVLDQEKLVVGQFCAQVFGALEADGLGAGRQAGQELARDALQVIDQLVGISRLFTE
ncbi:hypothetical protein D3C80_1530440 [compost metagenome]